MVCVPTGMTRPRHLIPATVAVCLGASAVAIAAPDREAELSTAKAEFAFDGGPVFGGPLVSADDDDTLLKLAEPGGLVITANEPGPTGEEDIDLEFFAADAAGEPVGDAIAESQEGGTDETISVKSLKAGTYLVRAVGFIAVEGTYRGKVKFTPSGSAAPAAPAPAPGATPAPGSPPSSAPAPAAADQRPDARLGKVARSYRASKLKGFRGTASDDRSVARVEVAVELKKGKKCTQMTSKGKFVKAKCGGPTSFLAAKGTTTWTAKLPKRLKKGGYTVFARAVDGAGQVQGGYTSANKKAFKVK